jgi:hypothetical protein
VLGVYVDDDEIVASDLSEAYASLLSPDLPATLESERQSTHLTAVRTTRLYALPRPDEERTPDLLGSGF